VRLVVKHSVRSTCAAAPSLSRFCYGTARVCKRPFASCYGTARVSKRPFASTFGAMFSLSILMVSLSACGYHVAGQADTLPKSINVIAVPAFGNITVRYKLTDSLPNAIAHEFIARSRYKVVSDPGAADAVLKGSVVYYNAFPTVFDQATGRASGLQVNVRLQITLTERATGKVLFSRPSYEYHQRYEISVAGANAAQQYFEESATALNRLSGDVARDIVSAILENF